MNVIQAENIVKTFGDFKAVDGMSLTLREGECYGLLGPNGAGKSTFIGMTYGTCVRTSGRLEVFGLDPDRDSRSIKRQLGVVTQDNALDESLTVIENMQIYAAFMEIPRRERKKRVEELLEFMNLAHKSHMPIRTLSGGMRRRLVFVRALLAKPRLVILDEPTTGLDPAVRHLLWGKVRELKASGTTVLLTTHYMHEAEILCDRVAVMNRGRVIAEGTPQEMIASQTPGYVGVYPLQLEELLSRSPVAEHFELMSDSSGVFLRGSSLEALVDLRRSDPRLTPLQIRPANLEDVFLKMTGKELDADA